MICVNQSDDREEVRVGLDGFCDVNISEVTCRYTRDCRSTFGVGHRGCTAKIALTKNNAHIPQSFAPQLKIICGSPPSLYRSSKVQSDCSKSSWNICGQSDNQVIYNLPLY